MNFSPSWFRMLMLEKNTWTMCTDSVIYTQTQTNIKTCTFLVSVRRKLFKFKKKKEKKMKERKEYKQMRFTKKLVQSWFQWKSILTNIFHIPSSEFCEPVLMPWRCKYYDFFAGALCSGCYLNLLRFCSIIFTTCLIGRQ